MELGEREFAAMSKFYRVNFFNSVMGVKNVVLIGSTSMEGQDNLAIFSSLFHMGSNPPLFGVLFRPAIEGFRHSLQNIEETGFYTLNNVISSTMVRAHATSGKYEREESEFDVCGLASERISDFQAPFVKESTIRMGMKWIETLPITHNNTQLVIGQVLRVLINPHLILEDGYVDSEEAGTVACSGLDSYHRTDRMARLPRITLTHPQ